MEEESIKFEDLILGRVLQESKKIFVSNIEKEYILEIFKKDSFLSENFPNAKEVINSIQILDRNFFYDIYKFYYEDVGYAIKIGSDVDIEIFEREKIALDALEGKNLAPSLVSINKLDNYSYLLTSFEHGFTAESIGKSMFYDKIELFAESLAKLHNETKQESNERDYFLDSFFSVSRFEEFLDDEVIDELKKMEFFKNSVSLLEEIEEAIKVQLPEKAESLSSICHTNLRFPNILFRSDLQEIKFCNFYNSFVLNPLWDLGFAIIRLELQDHPIIEDRFLNCYFQHSYLNREDFSMVFYKQICFKLILHKVVSTYFLKMVIPEESGSVLEMFKNYSIIRDMVQNEFPTYVDTLDAMFNNFSNSI